MTTATLEVVLVLVSLTCSCAVQPTVHTTSGVIRGIHQNFLQKEVHAFIGVPYATPPVGDLRFKKPIPVEKWNGTFNATEFPPACMQHGATNAERDGPYEGESEDCLYLNVWVPIGSEDDNFTLKNIMVWIHGGGFHSGSISLDLYDGGLLSAYGDVVVASINYRLGVFGFFHVNNEEAPGNMGLLDQVLALKWVKENAINLGGDPDRITIFGESAGSLSVSLHILSPLSTGLFQRAIMQSGSPMILNDVIEEKIILTPEEGLAIAESLARTVGCVGVNQSVVSHPGEIVGCIRQMDAQNLTRVTRLFYRMMFIPRYADEFMPIKPSDIFALGQYSPIDILAGVTSQEASGKFYFSKPEMFNKTTVPRIPKEAGKLHIMSQFNSTVQPSPAVIADFYLDGVEEEDYESVLREIISSVSDVYVVCPTVFFSEAFVKVNSTVYVYVLDHHPSISLLPPYMSMQHFDDVQFVFGVPLRNNVTYTEEERELSRSVMDKWISFARTGVPVLQENEEWPKFNMVDQPFLKITSGQSEVGSLERCDFWREYLV